MPHPTPLRNDVTLGLLAGGQATRLGGRDKAWERYGGATLVERTQAMIAPQHPFTACLVSANRDPARYRSLGMQPVADRIGDFPGPLAGIEALLAVCKTDLLMAIPIDLRTIPADLVARLFAVGESGAVASDASGMQPLVAIWPVERARVAVAEAFAQGDTAVRRVVAALALPVVRFEGADFGNLNTPLDFLA